MTKQENTPEGNLQFSEDEKNMLTAANRQLEESETFSPLSTFEDISLILDNEQVKLISSITAIDPATYGFKVEFLDREPVPNNIVSVEDQKINIEGEEKIKSTIYLPQHIHKAYLQMNEDFRTEHVERYLVIDSAYRSPAWQVFTLIYYLTEFYDYNLNKTLKRVALPAYSQHCSSQNTALDFMTIEGVPSDAKPLEFAETLEYVWLSDNASTFGFVESYPKDNDMGVMWEPWHWQYQKQDS